MSSESSRDRPARARSTPPDPYAKLWAGAERRRSAHRRSRRHTVRVTVVSVIAVVVAGLLAVPLVQHWVPAGTVSWGPALLGARGADRSATLPADPFTGTPAERYPRAADGIVLPRPTAIGSWSASDVGMVLRRTRDVLVAARLDPRMVEQGTTARYLALLAPATRAMVRQQVVAGGPGLGYVTRLAPGWTIDAKAGIRVAGTMSVKAGKDRQLVVTADYVWVYPLKGGTAKPPPVAGSRLVVLRTVETYEWYPPESITVADRGLRPGGGTVGQSNMDCTLADKGLLALPPPGQKGRPAALSDPAYSPKTQPGAIPDTC
ncbi:MAG TPA: hypothetical protein VGD72_02050 [Mycobacteriales bacterium]|jgi:hypothetical protein